MNPDAYIKQRVDDQIEWYSRKSSTNKNWFYALKIIELICAAIIPFLAGIKESSPCVGYLIAALGIAIAICAGLTSIFHFHENWVGYRATSETLKHEKFLFMTRSGTYSDENAFESFVHCVESHISKENSTWASVVRVKEEKNA